MLKTIIIISIVILVNSQNQKADCSKIDQIIKDVDVGLKLSKIKAELISLTQFSQELESATIGFRTAVAFIKKLKNTYDHKVLLQQSQVKAEGPSKQQPQGIKGPNSPQRTYNQLAEALSEIRAVSRIYPELEKALLIFNNMRDDVNQFRTLAKDLNGSQYVLEPNIYESSSSEVEEVIHKVQAQKTYAQGKQAPSGNKPTTKQTSIRPKNFGIPKQVRGHNKHNKHNAKHHEKQQILVVKQKK